MSHAFLATSVPAMNIAKPTSDFTRAGASFVPSPVTATVAPSYWSPVTSKNLSSGEDLAKTFKFSLTTFIFPRFLTYGIFFFSLSASLPVAFGSST